MNKAQHTHCQRKLSWHTCVNAAQVIYCTFMEETPAAG